VRERVLSRLSRSFGFDEKIEKNLAKIYGEPTEPLHPKYRKKTKKNNHVNLCSTRDPIHTHTVIYRFRAIASPPRGHRRQAQRSCPPRERPPEGILDIFFARWFFCFFLYFGCRGSVGSNILSWVHHIYLPKNFRAQIMKNLLLSLYEISTLQATKKVKKRKKALDILEH